jgi:hypothetical protein
MQIETASAERLAFDTAALAVEPPPPVDYVRWAERNIAFTERESPFPGPYNRNMFPYFDEPLRALSARRATFFASGRCAGRAGEPRDPRVTQEGGTGRPRRSAAPTIYVPGPRAHRRMFTSAISTTTESTSWTDDI